MNLSSPIFWSALVIVVVLIIAGAIFLQWQRSNRTSASAAGLSTDKVVSANNNGIGSASFTIGAWILVFGSLGFTIVILWSWGQGSSAAGSTMFWATLGTDAMIAIASAGVGGLLGFIFGIPRTLDPSTRVAVAAAASQATPAASSQAALAANTNLERISDWLTTLLIGATLVQANDVIKWVGALGEKYKGGADGLSNEAFIPAVVIYFFALSFLGVYLITRLYLTYALQQTLALLTGVTDREELKIITESLPDGAVGSAYTGGPVQAIGGTSPLLWSVMPPFPQGLELNQATGEIIGTPVSASEKKTYRVTVSDKSNPPLSSSKNLAFAVV